MGKISHYRFKGKENQWFEIIKNLQKLETKIVRKIRKKKKKRYTKF